MMKHDPNSKYVWFEDNDMVSHIVISIFKQTDFEYSQVTGKPTNFIYLMLKDNIKDIGLKPKDYRSLLTAMCKSFIKALPSK